MEIPTLPVDQCHSHLIRYLKGCWGLHSYRRAAKKGRHAFGTHMVYRETFLQIHMHLHQHFIHKNWIHGVQQLRSRFTCLQRRKVKDHNKIEIWDASLDRQPKIQSSSDSSKNYGQTNNDCRFLISTLTSSLHQQPLLAGRWGSRPRYVLAHNSLRKRCNRSKKCSWLIQWVNWDLSSSNSWYFNAEFWSTWCEDCFSTEQNHPYFPYQKKNQSGGSKGPEAGPFPSRQTDCLLDLRSLPGHWEPWFCRKLRRPIRYCSSKWRYSGIRF